MKNISQKLFFLLWVKPFLALFTGMRVKGRGNLPGHHPFILIANHSSHLDTVSLLNLFPLRQLPCIHPVAAADYFERNKFISWLSKTLFNILPIARKGITRENNPVEAMKRALGNRRSLLVFPEGTRSRDGEPKPFRSGIARVIKENPAVPVIPCFLTNMWKSLPKGEWLPVPFICEIAIGEKIFPTGNLKEITAQLEGAILKLKTAGTQRKDEKDAERPKRSE